MKLACPLQVVLGLGVCLRGDIMKGRHAIDELIHVAESRAARDCRNLVIGVLDADAAGAFV